MAIEDWIDDLVAVAGSVQSHTGGYVRAYKVFSRAEIPEALNAFPSAITYPTQVWSEYSDSGPCYDLVQGVTEFHLMPTTAKTNLPEVIRYFGKIRSALAANRTLAGKVAHMALRGEGMVLVAGQYGDEAEHHVIMVYWEVKALTGDEITLGL